MSTPLGVAIDSADNWIVTNRTDSCIRVFAKDGAFLTSFPTGIKDVVFNVCVDHDNRIWMASVQRVYVFAFG